MFEQREPQAQLKFLSTEEGISSDLSSFATNFQVQKNINQLAGSFQITLVPKSNKGNIVADSKSISFAYKNIMPMDLISIGVEEEGGMMLGIVDNVYKTKTIYGKQVSRSIQVRGRDFGKMLVEDNTFFAPSVDDGYVGALEGSLIDNNIIGDDENALDHPLINMYSENRAPERINKDGKFLGNTFFGAEIDESIEYVLKNLTSLRINTYYDGRENVPAHELLKTDIICRNGDELATDSHNRYNGSIGNLLYNLIDREFYELFIETYNGQAVLVVRPKPFDRVDDEITQSNGTLRKLTKDDKFIWEYTNNILNGGEKERHEIPENDIINLGLGVSDYEAFSVYVHNARNSLIGANYDESGFFFPMTDVFSLGRYGLKKKESVTNLIPITRTDDKKEIKDKIVISNRIKGFRDRLYNWYRYNPVFESGNITVRGHDYYKLGDKVYLKDEIAQTGDRGILAYCVGYTHRWGFGQPYLTQMNLIRGENEALFNKFKNLTNKQVVRSG